MDHQEQIGIRRALPADCDVLESVRLGSIKAASAGWPAVTAIEERIAAQGVFTYLAEDAAPFGYVTVGPPVSVEGYFDDREVGEILEWYLLPRLWQAGYGRKLLVHGLTVLKRRLCERAVIWVPEAASRSIQLLDQAGFEPLDAEIVSNTNPGTVRQLAYEKDLSSFF